MGALLRFPAFFLPSNIGDPTAYQSLAMKMNYGFMRQYDIFNYKMQWREEKGLVDYVWTTDPKEFNARRIRGIYHRPLHLQPPLFPLMIWLSHGIFNRGEPYTSVGENRGWDIVKNPPWNFLHAQFYAIIVPYSLSVGTLLLVYLFCLRFFTYREGLLAVLILITSPVDIAIGPKLYADGILTFFTFLTLYLFFWSLEEKTRKGFFLAAFAGIALGLSYLTKVTGILFAFGLIWAQFLYPEPNCRFWKRIFSPKLILAGMMTLFVISPWLGLMWQHYGNFFINTPHDPGNPWYHYVFGRPLYAYPLDMFWFVPATLIGWGYGLFAWRHPQRQWKEAALLATSLFYLFMFMVFMKTGTAGVEDRYLLPIYPPLAILAACGLVRVGQFLPKTWAKETAYVIVFLLLGGLGWSSALTGLHISFSSLAVFKPFDF